MKKVISYILLGLVLMSCAALAEGKITATQRALYIYDGKDSGFFYAKLENTGDSPIGIDSGKLVVFDDNDEIICTKNYITPLPNNITLEEGEYVYCKEFLWEKKLENATIGDVKFSVDEKERKDKFEKIPCEATFKLSGTDSYCLCFYNK